jgi:hypothetical protein
MNPVRPALMLGSLLALASPALAQTAPETAPEASAAAPDDRIRQAAEAYDRGDFDRALELLQAAYDESQKPALLFNMAQVQRSKNDCATAAATYRRFLDTTTADDPNRPRAERYEGDMLACAAREAVPKAPDSPALTPRPPPDTSPSSVQLTQSVPPIPDQPAPAWTPRRITAYALLGAGVLAAGASGATAWRAIKTQKKVVDFNDQPGRDSLFKRQQAWAWILGGTALVSAGTGVTLLAF